MTPLIKMTRRFSPRLVSAAALVAAAVTVLFAQPGTLLQTVSLPGNGSCNVAGTLAVTTFGTHYLAINSSSCAGTTLGIYVPPASISSPSGPDPATALPAKSIVDSITGAPVVISGLAWDALRTTSTSIMVWGVHANNTYLIAVGDPTTGGTAVATFMYNSAVGGIPLTDGLAHDTSDDTLYESPDVSCCAYQLSLGTAFNPANPPMGTLMNTVVSKNAVGVPDGAVSGVAIGSANTLYIGRNGFAEIRRIDKTTGTFVSTFATTAGRVEALTCDPVTYAPLEAILAKDAFMGQYEAFEVEPGTCPLPGEPEEPKEGRMTGGGRIVTSTGRVTHGFELHCTASDLPNNLQVNWGGNRFHLEILTSATCTNDPMIAPEPPKAGFDTYKGKGTGRYNGMPGATAEWTFTDAGEPGKSDTMTIEIKDSSSAVVLFVPPSTLDVGNHQAHEDK